MTWASSSFRRKFTLRQAIFERERERERDLTFVVDFYVYLYILQWIGIRIPTKSSRKLRPDFKNTGPNLKPDRCRISFPVKKNLLEFDNSFAISQLSPIS